MSKETEESTNIQESAKAKSPEPTNLASSDRKETSGFQEELHQERLGNRYNNNQQIQRIHDTHKLEQAGLLPSILLSEMQATSLSGNPRTDMAGRSCKTVDPTIADGKLVPIIEIERAGLPPQENRGSLSAVAVKNQGDKSDERTLLTSAHGMVKLPKENNGRYAFLDEGFKQVDLNNDGNLSKEEILLKKSEFENLPDPAKSAASGIYQSNYLLDNFDEISAKSKELDPASSGVSNEGLAQYYMENARIKLHPPEGNPIPVRMIGGNRNTDVAVLKAESLTQKQLEGIGEPIKISDNAAQMGAIVTVYGHGGGLPQADISCREPDKMAAIVRSGEIDGLLIKGKVQRNDAVTFSGMSGGPVLSRNRQGEPKLVGINHARDQQYRSYMIPATILREELKKLKSR